MSLKISDKGAKPKLFYEQFSIALTPLERAIVEYYSKRYGQDRVAIIRGMLRKYMQSDSHFDSKDFKEWALKSYVPLEENKEAKAALREQIENCDTIMGFGGKSMKKGA